MPLNLAEFLNGHVPEPRWLIKGLLHTQQLVVTCGEAGVGKSFFWHTAAMAVAAGKPFLGSEVLQGPVVYFDDENSEMELRPYLYKIWHGLGKPDVEALTQNLIVEHFKLSAAGDSWAGYMASVVERVKPVLVVIDTANSSLGVVDENDNAEAGLITRRLRVCMSKGRADATLQILKHARDRDVRGAKMWKGVADMVLYQARMLGKAPKSGYRSTTIEALKVRSWGLRAKLKITPQIDGNGVTLKAVLL